MKTLLVFSPEEWNLRRLDRRALMKKKRGA
jgi:hypothetical protein